jgi:hypothetical protein
MTSVLLAQQFSINGQTLKGPLVGITKIGDIISIMTTFLVPFAAIILLFVLIWGGYDFTMSQGSPEKIKSGRAKITTGLIGFIILVVSYVFVKLLTVIFGIGQGIF